MNVRQLRRMGARVCKDWPKTLEREARFDICYFFIDWEGNGVKEITFTAMNDTGSVILERARQRYLLRKFADVTYV